MRALAQGGAIAILTTLLLAACTGNREPPDPSRGTLREASLGERVPGGIKIGRPYQINGRWYYPAYDPSYAKVGVASWYGSQFHGLSTANGEIFDKDEISAAHPTLPLPSLVRVTNLDNGRSMVIRVNDRGPFVDDRLIDLSQAAARELGYEDRGLANVRVEFMGLDNGTTPVRQPPAGSITVASLSKAPLDDDRPQAGEVVRASFITPDPARRGRALVTEATAVADRRETASQRPTLVTSYEGPLRPRSCPTGAQFVQVGAFGDTERVRVAQAKLGGLAPVRTEPVFIGGSAAVRVRLGPSPDLTIATHLLDEVRRRGYADSYLVPVNPRAPKAAC